MIPYQYQAEHKHKSRKNGWFRCIDCGDLIYGDGVSEIHYFKPVETENSLVPKPKFISRFLKRIKFNKKEGKE